MTDKFAKTLVPIIAGGTGSASDSEYLPDYLPEDFLGKVQYVELAKEFAHRAATITETDGKEIDKRSIKRIIYMVRKK